MQPHEIAPVCTANASGAFFKGSKPEVFLIIRATAGLPDRYQGMETKNICSKPKVLPASTRPGTARLWKRMKFRAGHVLKTPVFATVEYFSSLKPRHFCQTVTSPSFGKDSAVNRPILSVI